MAKTIIMGNRLDQERQQQLEPERLAYAKAQIEKLGFEVRIVGTTALQFEFNGSIITFYAYSGWVINFLSRRGRNGLLNSNETN